MNEGSLFPPPAGNFDCACDGIFVKSDRDNFDRTYFIWWLCVTIFNQDPCGSLLMEHATTKKFPQFSYTKILNLDVDVKTLYYTALSLSLHFKNLLDTHLVMKIIAFKWD